MAMHQYHWNGNLMCVIDVETTGLDPSMHEIWQICILPVDSNIDVRKDVMPFYIHLRPESPEYIDWTIPVMKHNREKIVAAIKTGFDQERAKDLLTDWINKLNLPYNKSGYNRCKIIPLGHNFGFDLGFLRAWLGKDMYEENFHIHYRDTMLAAAYLNDRAAMHGNDVLFAKLNLQYLCSTLNVHTERAHDAMSDCISTSQVYKLMLKMGALG